MGNEISLEFVKKIATMSAVRYLAPILQKSCDETLRDFISSRTYALIQDNETRMWAESGIYLGDWYLEELAKAQKDGQNDE